VTATDPPDQAGGEDRHVGIAELAVATDGARLVTSGLGSCVAVALHDADVRGLAHVMLPEEDREGEGTRPAKYADSGVRRLVEEMVREGADREAMTAKLAGGSEMLALSQRVGERNVAAVETTLDRLDVPVVASEVGGERGRSLVFVPDGDLVVRTAGGEKRRL
jgi:chemotaxis protein CheD